MQLLVVSHGNSKDNLLASSTTCTESIVEDVAPEASFLQDSGRVLVEGLLLLPISRECACMNLLL